MENVKEEAVDVPISIIVPVYNVETYLQDCMDSVLDQTFSDFEVICVDDASKDSSLRILNEYAGKDERVKTMSNPSNRGLSYTRNIGLCQARGKYILFLDSDDMLSKNALDRMYSAAEGMQVEVLSFSSQTIYEIPMTDVNRYNGIRSYHYPEEMDGIACYLKQLEKEEYKCTVWQYLFRHDFLLRYNLQFAEGIYHEDLLYTFFTHMHVSKMMIINEVLHYYRIRSDSLKTCGDIVKSVASLFYIYMKSLEYSLTVSDKDLERNDAVEKHLMSMKSFVVDFFNRCNSIQKKNFIGGLSDIQKHIFYMLTGYGYGKKIDLSNDEIEFLSNEKNIYVYGAGQYAQRIILELNVNGIHISGILVSNKEKNLNDLLGYKIYKYSDIAEQLEGAVVIPAVSKKYLMEIMDILSQNQGVVVFRCSQL